MLRSVILKNRFFKGILSCLIAGSVFGAQWPIAGSALQIVDPYWFTLIRYLIVASILAIILFYKEGKEGFKLNRKEFPKILFLGTMENSWNSGYNFSILIDGTNSNDFNLSIMDYKERISWLENSFSCFHFFSRSNSSSY